MADDDEKLVEPMVRQLMDSLQSTPLGRSEVQRLDDKDAALTKIQRERGISDEIVEAAIKEWVLAHDGNFEWDLDQVKSICIRQMNTK